MKRLLSILTLALPFLGLTSCDDDKNDLPDVDFVLEVADASYSGGELYVVQGNTLKITSLSVVNKEQGKQALIPYANYYWDYIHIFESVVAPYGCDIFISDEMPVGKHVLEIYAPVYAVDKSPAFSVLQYTVNVVASADDIPADGATSFTAHPGIQETDPSK